MFPTSRKNYLLTYKPFRQPYLHRYGLTTVPALTLYATTEIATAICKTKTLKMNYAPMSDPEDYGIAQSQEMGGVGDKINRCCDRSGPWGVDIFASCIAGCWAGVLACFDGCGDCCGDCLGGCGNCCGECCNSMINCCN